MDVPSLEFQCAMRVMINFSVDELRQIKKESIRRLLRKCQDILIGIEPEFKDMILQIKDVADRTPPDSNQAVATPEMIIQLGEDPTSSDEPEESWDDTDTSDDVGAWEDSHVRITHAEQELPAALWPKKLYMDIVTEFATFAIRIHNCENHGQRVKCMIFPIPNNSPSQLLWQTNLWHVINSFDDEIIEFGKFLVREIYCFIHFFANERHDNKSTTSCNTTVSDVDAGK